LDRLSFVILMIALVGAVFLGGMANIQTDAIDYYAILQRLVGETPAIVPNLPFVEQRSPGYPLLSLPVYYALQLLDSRVTSQVVPGSARAAGGGGPERPSEQALLPPEPLRFKDVFFKNFDLAPQGSLFKWSLISALLLTSYVWFFAGIAVSSLTLRQLYPEPAGVSLPLWIVVASSVLMHNMVNTPAYATLAVFGASSLFTYSWVRGWQNRRTWTQWSAGLIAGLMVLIRLETVLIVAVLAGGLAVWRDGRFLRNFVLGGLLPLAVLLGYNLAQFGNPLQAAIFKGDMNLLRLDLSYVLSVLIHPQSGLLFWSALIMLGLTGLFFSRLPFLKALGWASLALTTLIALRVPVMYYCIGQGTQTVSGLSITCPADAAAVRSLIRFDANRYIIPLVPFAILGLRGLLQNIVERVWLPKTAH
jgi:hypothetical protein